MPEQLPSQLEGIHAEVMKRVESASLETSGEQSHKQTLHQVVGERLGKAQTQPTQASQQTEDLPPEVQAKVDELVQYAMHKDIDKAISEARRSDDPVVIDAFHDKIVGELYDRLVSEGRLKSLNK